MFKLAGNSHLEEIAVAPIKNDRSFTFNFTVSKEDVYIIGENAIAPKNRYVFYFKPGDQLNVIITPPSYELFGANTAENKALSQWNDFIQPIEHETIYSSRMDFTVFFPFLDHKLADLKNACPLKKTKNKVFNQWLEKYISTDILQNAILFAFSPRAVFPKAHDFIDYYKEISLEHYTSTDQLLRYPNGVNLLRFFNMLEVMHNESLTDDEKATLSTPLGLLKMIDKVGNPYLQGEVVLLSVSSIKTADGLDGFLADYGRYITDEGQKKRLQTYRDKLVEEKKEVVEFVDAPAFTVQGFEGESVSLADFKGKVVYIDVWATWCGPCMKEIPSLKELEKEYRDKENGGDIVFISLSVDSDKDYDKWKEFVVKNEMKGEQLWIGDNKTFRNDYGVKSIPHFILIGKDGKLLMDNAPRASSIEIRKVLDKALSM